MQTITLKATTDENGILRVELPVDVANTEYEVVVVFQAALPEQSQSNGSSAKIDTDHSYVVPDTIPPAGTPARLAYEAHMAGIRTNATFDLSETGDILNAEFADYLLNRMDGEDGA